MIGGMYQASQEMPNAHMNAMSEITQLIQLLITEIRETFNSKIEILNEKIDMKTEENEYLRTENRKLQQIIAEQTEKITALCDQKSNKNETMSNTSSRSQPENKQRGMKAHNLIITSSEEIHDPRKFMEDMFLEKFRKKPMITTIQPLTTTTNTEKQETDDDSQNSKNLPKSQMHKFLVTLNSIWDARAIYKQRVQALKNTGLYIGEDLDKSESYLFYLARKLKKEEKIYNTWTENGETYILENRESSPRKITINDPILDHVKTTKANSHFSNTEQKRETQPSTQDTETGTQTSKSDTLLNSTQRITRQMKQNGNT